ncbi:MAG TPA: DUF5069 domain-containing protein [Candidatus Lustribacter sp.]
MQQNAKLPYPGADLREHPPRSARDMLGGIYFLARTIDKTRAKIQGTLGPYKIQPGISGYVFEALGITEEQFTDAVRAAASDDDIVRWVHANTDASKYAGLNDMLVNRRIRDAEHRAQVLPANPVLLEYPDLWNWFEIFEIDDKWMYEPANRGQPGAAPAL